MKENSPNLIEVGNTKLEHELKRGLLSSKDWSVGEDSFPLRKLDVKMKKAHSKDIASMSIEYDSKTLSSQEHDIERYIKDCVKKMGDLGDRASDLFDVLKYLWTIKAACNDEFAVIHANEVAELLGFKRLKNGTYKVRDKKMIANLIDLLKFIQIEVSIIIYEYDDSSKKRSRRFNVKSPALVVNWCIEESEEEDEKTKSIDYKWEIKPGKVLAPFLDAPNKRWAYLDLKLLQLNPVKDKFTKRIGKSATWFFKVNFKNYHGRARLKVKTLLADALIDLNRRNPGKTAESFEVARLKLVKEGIFKTFCYEDEAVIEILADRPKGWAESWAESFLIMEPPKEIVALYEKPNKQLGHKTNSNALGKSDDVIELIENFMSRNSLTQPEVASLLGCSQSYISMILKGQRNISKKLRKDIIEKCSSPSKH